MPDQPTASSLAKEAFEEWQAGQHLRSKALYEKALSLADPNHLGLPTYHGEFACVLNELGDHEAATEQLVTSLAVELAQGNPEGSIAVTVARYFLSEQLLRVGSPDQALEVLAPSVVHAPNDWCTRASQARALFALGRKSEAKAAALLAIENAPSAQKAEDLRVGLSWALREADA